MSCQNCGAPLKEGAVFCTSCGFKTPAAAPAPAAAAGMVEGEGYKIDCGPAFSLLTMYLHPGQSVQTESGAMVGMSAHIQLTSEMKGGVMGALKRAVTKESLFQSTFTAQSAPGELLLAPATPGDIAAIPMNGQKFFVQGSSYLASDPGLQMDTKWGGLKTFFSKEGLFMIMITGSGRLFVSSFGAIVKKTLQAGERYVVDTGHLVAFEHTIQYTLRKASQQGWFRSMTSGEGVVAEYTGPGDLFLQTRNLEQFAGVVYPFFPKQGGSGGGFNVNLGG